MTILFTDSAASVESLQHILFGNYFPLEATPHPKNKLGNSDGVLVGGNLSLLVDSLGTSTEVDTTEKILVIEEVDEFVYKVDRMLVQLKRAKKLQNLSGLAVGHMTDIKETELPFGETIEQVILNHTKDYQYPVAFNFPIGHQSPNLAWVQGATASLRVTEQGSSVTLKS
jgi:muramoyltetrapeptide carboxypeptidase